jgi:hypothetical protein
MARVKISDAVKKQVIDRAKGICEYCRSQVKYSPNNFEVEHVYPLFLGGTNTLENLALACPQCNGHKSTKTEAIDPVSEKVVALFHLRQMVWADHFVWQDDTLKMVGTTAIGRATVSLLQTNRPHVVNLRQLLRQQGLHPLD